MQQDQQLSPHFALSELTASQTATRLGLRNEPGILIVENLKRLALLLEQVRGLLGGKPILISSGYRSQAVNRAVGGAASSAHVDGLAADFICPGYGTPRQICQAIQDSPLRFDQLIFEGTWVHLAAPKEANTPAPRRDVITALFSGGSVRYLKGIV